MVLFVTLLGVLCLGMILLFNTGQVVNKKVRLTNAVDAAAYSVAVQQARVLNFAAYMNRGRVANEVAVAQMVSMFSWINMAHTHVGLFRFVFDILQSIPIIGVIFVPLRQGYGAVETVMKQLRRPGLMPGFEAAIEVIDFMDGIYATAARGVIEAGATGAAGEIASEVLVRNDPGAAMEPAAQGLLLRQAADARREFIGAHDLDENGRPTPGMDRYRNVVMESRDLFSRTRMDKLPMPMGDHTELTLPMPPNSWISPRLSLEASIEVHGGTDMVEYDRWAAMDTLAWVYRYEISADVKPPFCPFGDCTLVRGIVAKGSQDIAMGWGGGMAVPDEDNRRFSPGMRNGNGWTSFYERRGRMPIRHFRPYDGVFDAAGDVSLFGSSLGLPSLGAAELAEFDPSVSKFPMWRDGQDADKYLTEYQGLRDYDDIRPGKATRPGTAADDGIVFTVYARSLHRQDDPGAGRTSEQIVGLGGAAGTDTHLPGAARDGRYTAIASAQVYFHRPGGVAHFARRLVGRERARTLGGRELGSLFSPYWQARLIDTPASVHAALGTVVL